MDDEGIYDKENLSKKKLGEEFCFKPSFFFWSYHFDDSNLW